MRTNNVRKYFYNFYARHLFSTFFTSYIIYQFIGTLTDKTVKLINTIKSKNYNHTIHTYYNNLHTSHTCMLKKNIIIVK